MLFTLCVVALLGMTAMGAQAQGECASSPDIWLHVRTQDEDSQQPYTCDRTAFAAYTDQFMQLGDEAVRSKHMQLLHACRCKPDTPHAKQLQDVIVQPHTCLSTAGISCRIQYW